MEANFYENASQFLAKDGMYITDTSVYIVSNNESDKNVSIIKKTEKIYIHINQCIYFRQEVIIIFCMVMVQYVPQQFRNMLSEFLKTCFFLECVQLRWF